MAARSARFVDRAVKLPFVQTSLNISQIFENNLPKTIEYFETEKSAHESFSKAWDLATDIYNSLVQPKLSSKDTKKINQKLVKDLPDCLKEKQSYLPIAIIVCTQDDGSDAQDGSNFFSEYNSAVHAMFTAGDWESFPFKGLFLLKNLAVNLLPSRPPREAGKFVFRGLDTERTFVVDEMFSLGYMASFTVKRFLALGKQPKNEVEDEENETDEDTDESSVAPKTLLKVEFTQDLQGLGVRHLSPTSVRACPADAGATEGEVDPTARGFDEKEVLVLPQQSFQVLEIKMRHKKGFKVVIVKAL